MSTFRLLIHSDGSPTVLIIFIYGAASIFISKIDFLYLKLCLVIVLTCNSLVMKQVWVIFKFCLLFAFL